MCDSDYEDVPISLGDKEEVNKMILRKFKYIILFSVVIKIGTVIVQPTIIMSPHLLSESEINN